jgi:HAD superfamily hydrolase (TIGR01509 family)
MSLPRAVRAVVFDMDGLLVDTEVVSREVMTQAALALGHELPDDVFSRMVGLNFATSRAILVEHYGEDFDVDGFWAESTRRYHAALDVGVALKTGVVELLDFLDLHRVPRAIATSSPHHDVERNLGRHGLKPRFDAIIARGDYARGKPEPDPFLKAAEALGVEPRHCLALEDSHNGIRAAHAAGMMAVMVPDLLEATDEIRALCARVIESLHEVQDLIAASEQSAPDEEQV